MKKPTLLIFCLITLRVAGQQPFESDSVVCRNHGSLTTTTIGTYDSNGNLIRQLIKIQPDDIWVNKELHLYTYDNGNLIHRLVQRWDSAVWKNYLQYTQTYDSAGNKITEQFQDWLGSAWSGGTLNTYAYNSNGNLTGALYQYWDDSTLVNREQRIFTFDSAGHQTHFLFQQWDSTDWRNKEQIIYTSDSTGKKATELKQNWDGANWVNATLINFSYTANTETGLRHPWNGTAWGDATRKDSFRYDPEGRLIYSLLQFKLSQGWANWEQLTQAYDIDGNLVFYHSESIYPLGNFWITANKTIYTYENGRLISHHTQSGLSYDSGYPRFFRDERCSYYYDGETHVDYLANKPFIKTYPNPFSESIVFSINEAVLQKYGNIHIRIHNLLGQPVRHVLLTDQHLRITRDGLPSGIYFYKALSEGGELISSGKLIAE